MVLGPLNSVCSRKWPTVEICCWNSIQESAAQWGLKPLALTRGSIPWGWIRQCSGEYLRKKTSESLLTTKCLFPITWPQKSRRQFHNGSMRRTYAYLDDANFLLLYKALIRPHLGVCIKPNLVSSPAERYRCNRESTLWRATKMLPGMRDLTHEQWLKKLKLPTLHYRWLRGDMIEMASTITE